MQDEIIPGQTENIDAKPLTAESIRTISCEDFIASLWDIARDTNLCFRVRAGARTLIELYEQDKKNDFRREGKPYQRLNFFMPRAIECKIAEDGAELHLLGYEKYAAQRALRLALREAGYVKDGDSAKIIQAMQDREIKDTVVQNLDPVTDSKRAELDRRQLGGVASGILGTAMLGKPLFDWTVNQGTSQLRQQYQLPDLVQMLKENPPPSSENKEFRKAYYKEVDRHVGDLVPPVQERYPWMPWLSLISGVVLVGYGSQAWRSAKNARKAFCDECAHQVAGVAGDVLVQAISRGEIRAKDIGLPEVNNGLGI